MSSFCHITAAWLFSLLAVSSVAQFTLELPVVTVADNSTGCHRACMILQGASTPPPGFQELYFAAQQQELRPACVIQPASVEEVSHAVRIIQEHECFFAVRSGGHCHFAGASSIHDGLVVDLTNLKGIQLSKDKSTAFIAAGNRWGHVYAALEEHGLVVAGGREASVGVGGFTLGGGISFLSRRYGWASSNVRNYELVLANGTIANVNPQTHPDLFFALRGGGNNFGIVTRFDMEAHRQDTLWGGYSIMIFNDLQKRQAALGLRDQWQWTWKSVQIHLRRLAQGAACRLGFGTLSTDLIDAFVELASDDQTDASAHAFIFLAWSPIVNSYLGGTTVVYSQPEANPPVFHNLTALKTLYKTTRLANMSDLVREVEELNPKGLRHSWGTATFKVDASLISQLWDIFLSEVDAIKTHSSALPSLNLQLLTKHEIALFSRNGGNPYGISEEDGPLFFFTINISYKNAEDDDTMKRVTQRLISRAIALGQEMRLHHRYIYQNYAGADQDVFAGYGLENRERLLQIQNRYDPEGVFSRLQPGYFKLYSATRRRS